MSESMVSCIRFQYRFHAAGQGIFASGSLDPDGGAKFHWVMDCGSTAPVEVLRPKVARYRDLVIGDRLDLLCISHFDYDHVSGLTDLLKGLHVDTVVMPYLSPLEKVVLASRHQQAARGYFSFLANPVLALIVRAASVRRIIVVGGGSVETDGSESYGMGPFVPHGPERREDWNLKLEGQSGDLHRVFNLPTRGIAGRRGLELVTFEGAFSAHAIPSSLRHAAWEFKFFHKPIPQDDQDAILQAVASCFPGNVIPAGGLALSKALRSPTQRRKVKSAYATALAKVAREDINTASLCTYTGPELRTLRGSAISDPWPNPLIGTRPIHPHPWDDYPLSCSLLYTGDADFSRLGNRMELVDFLTRERWDQIALLQVPHHGSIANWQPGSVVEFGHFHSVFCADEHNTQYNHPSREVLADLAHRGPILANKEIGWNWHGNVWFDT